MAKPSASAAKTWTLSDFRKLTAAPRPAQFARGIWPGPAPGRKRPSGGAGAVADGEAGRGLAGLGSLQAGGDVVQGGVLIGEPGPFAAVLGDDPVVLVFDDLVAHLRPVRATGRSREPHSATIARKVAVSGQVI